MHIALPSWTHAKTQRDPIGHQHAEWEKVLLKHGVPMLFSQVTPMHGVPMLFSRMGVIPLQPRVF